MTRENREQLSQNYATPRDHRNRPLGWEEVVHRLVPRPTRDEMGAGDRDPNPIKLLVKVYGLRVVGQWSEDDRNQKLEQLLEILEQPGILTENERDTLKARFIHGHTYADIRVQMGGSDDGTLAKYIRHGIDKLSWELAVLKDHQSFRELFFEAVGPSSLNWAGDEVLSAVKKICSHMSEFTDNEKLLLEYRYGLSGTILTYRQIAEISGVSFGTLAGARSRTLSAKVKQILEKD